MPASQKTNSSSHKDIPLSFLDQLQKCKEAENIVEVLTDSKEVTGSITTIGTDYLGILRSVEKTIETTATGADGTTEKQQQIIVYQIETFLKFEEIRAISRVLKEVPK